MPGIRRTRSSSSASFKVWEKKCESMAFTQTLIDHDVCRSDSMVSKTSSKRRNFLRRNTGRNNNDDLFVDEFSQACPGSAASSLIPKEEGIETIIMSSPIRQIPKKMNKKMKVPPPPPRTKWKCLPSSNHLPNAVTSPSSSDESRQERFDQSFDYAFNVVVWEKSTLESNRVDTTYASHSSSSASSSIQVSPPRLRTYPAQDDNPAEKSTKKWLPIFCGGRQKVKRSQSFNNISSPPRLTTNGLHYHQSAPPSATTNREREWPDEPELEDENNWETRMAGDEVEIEYLGNVTVQDWFSAVPDSPGNRQVASWGLDRPKEQPISLEMVQKERLDPPHEEPVSLETMPQKRVSSPIGDTTTGVMELGQYAREMQSLQSRSKASPSPKRPISLLLCSLPSFGKHKAGESQPEEDFPDPDLIEQDETLSLDDNSFLAVSYTGEAAQLVMSQADDLDYLEEQLKALELSPESSRNDSADTDEDSSTSEDGGVDVSGMTSDYPLQFLGEDGVPTFDSISSARSKSLGASYLHPAASKGRDDFATQLRQVRHPSPLSIEEGENPRNEGADEKPEFAGKRHGYVKKEVQGKITFHHYNLAGKPDHSGQLSNPESMYIRPTNPARTRSITTEMSKVESEGETPKETNARFLLRRRDDPPEAQDAQRTSGFYGCATATDTRPAYPGCSSQNAPGWLFQPEFTLGTDTTWGNTSSRTLNSRSVSTLSFSLNPLQERRSFAASGDIWDHLARPVQRLAWGVNETLCENIYSRTGQPPSMPFDEMDVDMRLQEGLPPWTKARTKSSADSFDYSEQSHRDRRGLKPQRKVKGRPTLSRPDPPSSVLTPRDNRRQLL